MHDACTYLLQFYKNNAIGWLAKNSSSVVYAKSLAIGLVISVDRALSNDTNGCME